MIAERGIISKLLCRRKNVLEWHTLTQDQQDWRVVTSCLVNTHTHDRRIDDDDDDLHVNNPKIRRVNGPNE